VTFTGLVIRVLLVLVVAALVGIAALQLSNRQESSYLATSELLFSARTRPEFQVLGATFTGTGGDADVRLATDAQLLNSFDIARIVADRHPELELTADQIADRTSAEGVTGTEIVRLNATGPTQEEAVAVAEAYQSGYLSRLRSVQRRRAARVERSVRERYESLSRTERRGQTGTALRTQLGALSVLQDVGSGIPEIVQRPRPSSEPTQPQTGRNTAFGIIFGLLLGIGLVAARDGLRRLGQGPPRSDDSPR
jgi:uncharacterized protein involved in exopolysaccharide biosynthesis